MTIYEFGLVLGFGGIVAMALLGLNNGAGDDTGDVGDASDAGEVVSDLGDATDADDASDSASSSGFRLAQLLSPRVGFSVLLGFGAAGTLGRKAIAEPGMLLVALLCGLAFELAFFRPTWNLIFRFASRPARTLESAIAEEAVAVTNFDQNGNGLVSIDLDGQFRQLLARLSDEARQSKVRIRVGDKLFVDDVDTQKNSCVVSPWDAPHD